MSGLLLLPSVPLELTACPGTGLGDEAVLAGDPTDRAIAWVMQGPTRIDVVFPPWLGARFTPDLEIVDPDGRTVARAGDKIDGGCFMGQSTPLLILWP
jgi:hypothetical protein